MNDDASHARLPGVALAALLAVLLTLQGCGGTAARHDRHVQQGREFLAAGNLEKARVEFGNALQIQPNDAEARFLSGRVAEKLGNVSEAVGAWQAAIDANPEHIQARANLGRVLVFAGAADRAMEIIEPALAKHPQDPDLLTVRGAARVQLKDRAGATADAELAVQGAPENENAVALLASLYRQSEDPARAVTLLEATVQAMPQSVDLRQVLASLYMSDGKLDRARELMTEVVRIRPDAAQYRVQLALLHARAKQLDEAEKVLLDGVAAMPADRAMKVAYVDFLAGQRSHEAGVKALQAYIAKDPKDADLQLALGTLQERIGDPQAAVLTYQRIAREQDAKAAGLAARNRMAAIELREGRPAAAGKLIDEVLARNAHDNDALIMRGNLALEKGDPAAAVTDLRAVLRDQPNSIGVLRVLARAHVANGELPLAEEALQQAMALAPRDAGVRTDLAELLARTQRVDQALPLLEEAVRIAPGDHNLREVLTRTYVAAGQLDQARSAAEDLKTLRPDLASGYFLAGMVAVAQKRNDDAYASLNKALSLQPAGQDTLAALTRLDLTAGRIPAAVARLRGAVQQDPRNAPAHNLLGELLLMSKDYDGAREQFGLALQITPQWWIPYRNQALTQLELKDIPGALAAYTRGVAATRHEPALVTDLAALQEKQGRADDAIKLYETLLVQRPKLELAANNLAMLLITHRSDGASKDRARDLTVAFSDSNNGALLDTYGWVRFKRGEHDQGLTALERAAELAPKSAVIRYHLGMAQMQAGQRDKARDSLQAALAVASSFTGSDEARAALAALGSRTG